MNAPITRRHTRKADFKTVIRIAKQLALPTVLRKQEGSDYVEYVGHWSDEVVASHIGTEMGIDISPSSVKHLRQQEFGHLQPSRFEPGGGNMPAHIVRELSDDIAKLRTTLSVIQSTNERYGQRLYEIEQHNKMLGKYRDADLMKRQDMLEAENRQLLNQISQLKLKIQHG